MEIMCTCLVSFSAMYVTVCNNDLLLHTSVCLSEIKTLKPWYVQQAIITYMYTQHLSSVFTEMITISVHDSLSVLRTVKPRVNKVTPTRKFKC